MARFEVGDRVQTGGGSLRTVVTAEPDETGNIVTVTDDGRYIVGHEREDYWPVPPPDPRDAVVEAAVAWVARLGTRFGRFSDEANAVIAAVQAWKAAQT